MSLYNNKKSFKNLMKLYIFVELYNMEDEPPKTI